MANKTTVETVAPARGDGRPVQEIEVLILGAGVCGVAAGVGLRRAGHDDFVIIERADDIGGTWHHNTYPGCAVDIPSHLYSFSYAPSGKWSRVFAPQPEVKDYLIEVVDRFDLRRNIRFGVELLDATWLEEAQRWRIRTTAGTYLARSFVSAPGPLHEPIIPALPGLSDFQGELFHSSSWPADLDLHGKRVVVLGTGASALQFVPRIQPEVASLTVLQRTPSWVLPKADWKITRFEKRLLQLFPWLARVSRYVMWAPMDLFFVLATRHPRFARGLGLIGKLNLRRHIKDPQLRRDLTPTYAPTCKRLGLSNDFLPAMAKDNVHLVTSPAASLDATSVTTTDGRVFPADVVIFGTGFQTIQHHPMNSRVRGRDGRTLEEVWQGSPRAFMGTSVPGFPNAYTMFGPNIGTLSGFVMAEAQTDYLLAALKTMESHGLASVDVTEESLDDFTATVDRILKTSTFAVGGCSSYYLDDKAGRVSLVWPWSMAAMRVKLRKFDLTAYRTVALSRERTEPLPAAKTG